MRKHGGGGCSKELYLTAASPTTALDAVPLPRFRGGGYFSGHPAAPEQQRRRSRMRGHPGGARAQLYASRRRCAAVGVTTSGDANPKAGASPNHPSPKAGASPTPSPKAGASTGRRKRRSAGGPIPSRPSRRPNRGRAAIRNDRVRNPTAPFRWRRRRRRSDGLPRQGRSPASQRPLPLGPRSLRRR
jgi:hypothetical protein